MYYLFYHRQEGQPTHQQPEGVEQGMDMNVIGDEQENAVPIALGRRKITQDGLASVPSWGTWEIDDPLSCSSHFRFWGPRVDTYQGLAALLKITPPPCLAPYQQCWHLEHVDLGFIQVGEKVNEGWDIQPVVKAGANGIRVPSCCGVKVLLSTGRTLLLPLASTRGWSYTIPSLSPWANFNLVQPSIKILCHTYNNGDKCLYPMKEDSNQDEDQHEKSVELTWIFCQNTKSFRLEDKIDLLPVPSQALPSRPTFCQTWHSLITWRKLTVLLGSWTAADLERKGEIRTRQHRAMRFWRARPDSYSSL